MGRDAFPWYRRSHRCWYVYHGGRQVRLHPDKAEAMRLWHDLQHATPRGGPSVAAVIVAYLADAETRLRHNTMREKRSLLGLLKKDRGTDEAASLTAGRVRVWIAGHDTWGRSRRWLAALTVRSCFRWAAGPGGLLESNPVEGL